MVQLHSYQLLTGYGNSLCMATHPLTPIPLQHRHYTGIYKEIGSCPDAQKTDIEGIIQAMEN